MEQSLAQQSVDLLWEAWQTGTVMPALPKALRPASRHDGYAVQRLIEAKSDQPIAGWKIAASNVAGQTHLNVDGPLAGRILAERVVAPGATLPLAANRMRVAEPEFAFRFARDIGSRDAASSVEEVLAAVDAMLLVLEMPDTRFADVTLVGAPSIIADNACAHDLVLGPEVTHDWRSMDLAAQTVTGHVAGRIEREGRGSNVLGDPRVALTWLVNEVTAMGDVIRAGQFVTTGTTMVPLEIQPGDEVMADFGSLGTINVRFDD